MRTRRTQKSIPKTPPGRPSRSRDECESLLLASRRLDWRFLLPEPDLDDVMYLGPTRGTLVASLRRFCASLTVSEEVRWRGEGGRRYDVMVAAAPSYETLQRLVEQMPPHGWLYLEADRRPQMRMLRMWLSGARLLGGARPLCHAGDYVAALCRLGLKEVEAYWHWPDLEACAEMIPLGSRSAVAQSLARRVGGPAARLKAAVGRGLLQLDLLARLVPCFSVVAHRAADQGETSRSRLACQRTPFVAQREE